METAAVYQVAFNYGVLSCHPRPDPRGKCNQWWEDFQWVAAKKDAVPLSHSSTRCPTSPAGARLT
jgi:hypothetical protein